MIEYKSLFLGIAFLCAGNSAHGQGTFVNLNFESANPAGYPPGSDGVPIAAVLPGWSGFYGTSQTSQVWYDGISIGGYMISVIDSNAAPFEPLQGRYSAFLFGGGPGPLLSSTISQTGLVPPGTQSLLMDAYVSGTPFVVTLGGQTINMIPLQTFANYTLYKGDITPFAGQVAALAFSEPPPASAPPSMFELDNIQFSNQPTPEPNTLSLLALGGLLFALRRRT